MSAERAVSPARSPFPLIVALVAGAALGAAGVILAGGRAPSSTWQRTAARASSPDKSQVAFVREVICGEGLCRTLYLGASEAGATELGSIASAVADEVVWTPDASRVGFVIDGSGLVLYDVQKKARVGTVRLLSDEALQTRRARGVTFSENGRAVTFDDCPRMHSGCRAGVVGIPQ